MIEKGVGTGLKIGLDSQRAWRRIRRPLAAIALCGMAAISLSACMGLAMGGAVLGTLAATDRRTLGAQTEDKAIDVKAESRARNVVGSAGHVNVNSFNRKVLLTGEVRDEAMKAAVEREVADVEGVESIVNELAVAGTSSLTSRSNDTLITGKVKASLVDTRDLSANTFKVITERGAVYLMGRVSPGEGNRAAEVTRGVSGVQKVVKVFEYIGEDEARQLSGTVQAQGSN
jgi:osmotically-inducible protein OsmY